MHDTPDGKYNYNSTLLGDLQPYAYGEGAYLSSQQSYQNIPHRIQKILPVIYLPEPDGQTHFRLSHSVDDGDIAFSIRLDKKSIFCTGVQSMIRGSGLGTVVEPFINLPTLNYILTGIQHACIQPQVNPDSLWIHLLKAMDPVRFGRRNFQQERLRPSDIVHIFRHIIRPFGVMRGSEKQGGQNEETNSPATWPVPFVATFVVDGREDHIVNMWHHMDVNSGDDLVIRLKPLPAHQYWLNHYYKNPISKRFGDIPRWHVYWQVVPDVFDLSIMQGDPALQEFLGHGKLPHYAELIAYNMVPKVEDCVRYQVGYRPDFQVFINPNFVHWTNMGYWHIGRTQIRMNKYMLDDTSYYYNDLANGLRSQYMLMTFEPTFYKLPLDFVLEFDTRPGVCVNRKILREGPELDKKAENEFPLLQSIVQVREIGKRKDDGEWHWTLVGMDSEEVKVDEPKEENSMPPPTEVPKRRKVVPKKTEATMIDQSGKVTAESAVIL